MREATLLVWMDGEQYISAKTSKKCMNGLSRIVQVRTEGFSKIMLIRAKVAGIQSNDLAVSDVLMVIGRIS